MNSKEILSKAIKSMIKEELKVYDKKQFKNINKQTPDKISNKALSTDADEIKVDDKKTKFLEAITNFVIEYNTNRWCDCQNEELVDKLYEVGKIIGAKKDGIKNNIEKYGKRPKIYAFEVAQLFSETPSENETSETYEVPSAEKKNDPEKAKEVKEKEVWIDGYEVNKEGNPKANVTDKKETPPKPKVKEMPTKAKTAKGIILMKELHNAK